MGKLSIRNRSKTHHGFGIPAIASPMSGGFIPDDAASSLGQQYYDGSALRPLPAYCDSPEPTAEW